MRSVVRRQRWNIAKGITNVLFTVCLRGKKMDQEREMLLKTIHAIAHYAMDRAQIAAMEQNKYAVSTWNHVASTLLDLKEQAESWDDHAIRMIQSHMGAR